MKNSEFLGNGLIVSGQCQLFRWQCFDDIGGYLANRAGGIDWTGVTTARMKGCKARLVSRKVVFSPSAAGQSGAQHILGRIFLW
jgi:biofilm PGA synthesis N-glycosyltransferase PgaC